MTDQRLRELERVWAQSGAQRDEVALLAARLQAGVLERERLALAAYWGHPAARAVVGSSAALAPRGLGPAILGLAALGWPATDGEAFAATVDGEVAPLFWQASVRMQLAAVHAMDPSGEEAVAAAGAWALCPCLAHRNAAGRLATCTAAEEPVSWRMPSPAGLARARAADLARQPRGLDTVLRCMRQVVAAMASVTGGVAEADVTPDRRRAERQRANREGASKVLDALCREVPPWAVGHADPLRGRAVTT